MLTLHFYVGNPIYGYIEHGKIVLAYGGELVFATCLYFRIISSLRFFNTKITPF